jgi:hypothetical protein
LAKNHGDGRKGQILFRYQLLNAATALWDKYDSDGNFMKTKKSPGPWKSIEKRIPRKPPRG